MTIDSRICQGPLIVRVSHADNQLVIFLNGAVVYDKRTEGDPQFSDTVELTNQLTPGINLLTLVGVDWGGRANFVGNIEIGNDNIPFSFRVDGTPVQAGMIWHTSYRILRN